MFSAAQGAFGDRPRSMIATPFFASFVVYSRFHHDCKFRWTVPGRLSAFAWPAALASFP